MLGLGRSSSRNPEVFLVQIVLPLVVLSCYLLDEDEACGVHVHQVVGGFKVNPVPRSLLWQGGCVKKCRLLEQNKRTLFSMLHTSQDKPSAKELVWVEARKLKSLNQKSSGVEIFHQVVSCQLKDFDPTSGHVT